ncbi:hypothetical protein ABZ816_21855 [Actinosynnema sp. NPDC047251]|uniref:Hydrolytic protein n=1 Tax=Saccharothrix espanaensis (strain ATCC 51144 / DSM 44229 / JCM 9112 / NBRC 15066 / NRRL 15764) TaxID=1179773 RepID=K0K628_SACES|nr:hypothetical protein [Saccharothrix espanaensis]CCH33751.1 hypothetical protein BN6_65090 [Saccharothrix espanaensis DSM 44229]
MGATATLSATGLAVEPGSETTCTVVVRNTGELVDQFTVDVVGDAAGWSSAEPGSVNLVPQGSAEVVVRFAPPRASDVPAGPVPFGVRVASREDPYGSVVEEGVVEVGSFTDLSAELVPGKVEAGRRGRFELAVDNVGNHPVGLRFTPSDPDGELDFRLDRREVVLAPGTAAFVKLLVKPRDTFLRGQPRSRPFRVEVLPNAGNPFVADGMFVQRQLMPKWLLPALLALAALAVLLGVLWFTVVQSAVKSAARDAATEQAGDVKAAAQRAEDSAGQAKTDSQAAKGNSEAAMQAVGLDPSAAPGAQPSAVRPAATPAGDPTDFRIAADSAITANPALFTDFVFTPADDKKSVNVSDIVLQNPFGDLGLVRVVRDANGTRSTILELNLANFRDLDRHYVQPLQFKPGEKIVFSVSCQNPAAKGNCKPAVSFSGRVA